MTTRFEAVAKASLGYHKFHKMKVLSSTDAQKLFKNSLESSGKSGLKNLVPARVWEMCGGLPLPIVTMAGLVASKPHNEQNDWTEVCESLFPKPQVCHKPEEFMRIISYCYTALPSDLKTCSLYLCLFPKGRKIRRKRVIRRWIAEGFVSEKEGLSVEDIAEAFFNQLIERMIIRPVENSSDGKVKRCQVHDMVIEYIISKAGEENFATVIGSQWSMPTRSNKVRRLALHSTDSKRAKEADRMNLSHVRSLTVFGSLDQLQLKSFKAGIVQVLDLEGCTGFKENRFSVSDICKMTLLKYLSLRGTDVSKLPSNIGDLKYLETLDVRETKVCVLPPSVGQLERIRYILGGNKGKGTGDNGTKMALKVPKEIKGIAKTLHVLSGIEVSEGSNTASELNNFTGLRKLAIYRLPISDQNMAPRIPFKKNMAPKEKSDEMLNEFISSIQYLSGYYLRSLVIDIESSGFLDLLDAMESPPIYLTSLELSGRLVKVPEWLPALSKLVKLTLSATALRADTLKLLSKLSTLFSLTFSVCAAHDPDVAAILEKNKSDCRGEIFVPSGGFNSLELLRIFIPHLPSLNFSEGAMSALKRLELRFKRLEGLHGIDKLGRLDDVIMTVDGQAGGPTKLIIDELKRSKGRYVLNVHE